MQTHFNFHFFKSEINKNLYVDQKTHMQTFIFFKNKIRIQIIE